jgi:hypothetical protein
MLATHGIALGVDRLEFIMKWIGGTMMKLAIIDIDGVIADSSHRFTIAKDAKEAHPGSDKEKNQIYWDTALNAALIPHDRPIEGAASILDLLEEEGYHILLLSSRPESLRSATEAWLSQYIGSCLNARLILKPEHQHWVKTLHWKTGLIQGFAQALAPGILFVADDEQPLLDVVQTMAVTGCRIRTTTHLGRPWPWEI